LDKEQRNVIDNTDTLMIKDPLLEHVLNTCHNEPAYSF